MLLLRRLIRNKQNTVMTNAQIIDILQSEFNICVSSSHELEVDIYIKIIKKYLKDWPQWEELERISTKLHNIKDYEAITKVLNHKYKNLKEYLGVMLEAAKPLAKDAVKNVRPQSHTPDTAESSKVDENIDTSDVVMEIQCTKEQLDHLFFRKPRLDLNNTVFNMASVTPSRISLKNLSYKQVLFGWCIKLNISLPQFWFIREVSYKLKHVLVNKVRNESVADVSLPTNLQMQTRDQVGKIIKSYSREFILKQFSDILQECKAQNYDLYADVLEILISELKDTFDKDAQYKIPGNYRRFANKYKYVRYLYAENDQSFDGRYDLQLEETVTPTYCYYFGKIGKIEKPIPPIPEWLKLECQFCNCKLPLNSSNLKDTLESHFNEVHPNEVDWQCTHCKRLYSIDYLTDNKWFHEC